MRVRPTLDEGGLEVSPGDGVRSRVSVNTLHKGTSNVAHSMVDRSARAASQVSAEATEGAHAMASTMASGANTVASGAKRSAKTIEASAKKLLSHHHVGYRTQYRGAPMSVLLQQHFGKDALIRRPLWALILVFACANATCVLTFALLFYACPASCYSLGSDAYFFYEMLWLSIHTFTTVGYGTVAPAKCIVPHMFVFFENFSQLLIVAISTSMLLSKFMRPSPTGQVRFSRNFLITDEADGQWLTFRLVRLAPQQLRDCELNVQCGVVTYKSDGSISGCSEQPLPLHVSNKSNLETWFVRHHIDDASPLHDDRFKELAFMNVELRVFDTAFMQETRIYHNYTPWTDMVRNARFASMKSWTLVDARDDESGSAINGAKRGGFLSRESTPRTGAINVKELHHQVDLDMLDVFTPISLPV